MFDAQRVDGLILRHGPVVAPVVGALVGVVGFGGYLYVAFVLHGLSAGMTWRFWWVTESGRPYVAAHALTLALAFPVIGPSLAWLVLSRQREARGAVAELYRNYIELRYQQPFWGRPVRDRRAAVQREASVRPLIDRLRFGELGGKLQAAEALSQLPDFFGLPALREALVHPLEETRLMASLTLIRLEQQLTTQLEQARRRYEQSPSEPETLWALATALHRMLVSGTTAQAVAGPWWQEIDQLLERIEALAGSFSVEQFLLAAETKAKLDQRLEALALLERACEHYPAATALWSRRCAWLYEAGDFPGLRELAPVWLSTVEPNSPDAQVARFWLAPGAEVI